MSKILMRTVAIQMKDRTEKDSSSKFKSDFLNAHVGYSVVFEAFS
jgi:hypothetical protein